VASLFCQHVAPKLPDGSSWDEHRETVADLMIETVNNHAPNFRRSVLARQILSRSISKEHSASSAAIYSMDRSICGK